MIAGLFGHRHAPDEPVYMQWYHVAQQWLSAHWGVLAVLIPVGGAILAGIMNHWLAVSRENRARRIGKSDVRGRVYKDLAARLIVHCKELQLAIADPDGLDANALRASNATLKARCEDEKVVDALGGRYVGFMATIDDERRSLSVVESRRGAAVAARVLLAYSGFVAEFGEQRQARTFEKYARKALR